MDIPVTPLKQLLFKVDHCVNCNQYRLPLYCHASVLSVGLTYSLTLEANKATGAQWKDDDMSVIHQVACTQQHGVKSKKVPCLPG